MLNTSLSLSLSRCTVQRVSTVSNLSTLIISSTTASDILSVQQRRDSKDAEYSGLRGLFARARRDCIPFIMTVQPMLCDSPTFLTAILATSLALERSYMSANSVHLLKMKREFIFYFFFRHFIGINSSWSSSSYISLLEKFLRFFLRTFQN